MRIPAGWRGQLVRSVLAAGFVMGCMLTLQQQARAQYVFAPAQLVDSFETAGDIARYTTTGDVIYVNHAQTSAGATRGASAMVVETEGAFALNDGIFSNGWGAIGGLAVAGNYTNADSNLAAYNAFQMAALNPEAWELVFDVSTDANSWTEAPSTTTSTTQPGDIGPDRSGSRVQLNYDGTPGTPFNTGSLWGTTGKLTVRVPFRSLYDVNFPLPTTGAAAYTLHFGADNNRFNPEDPAPNGGAKHYIDNVRLKPRAPVVPTVMWDFEDGTLQDWLDTGNSGTDTHHKHHNVTGLGATKRNPTTGKFELDPAGKALLIDTSNIAPSENGFQWATAMTLNADSNDDGVVDNAPVNTRLRNVISQMRKSDAIQFDISYHDPLNLPPGMPTPVVPGEPAAPWLKMVLGIWVDSTPADGDADGLTQFQYDNAFGIDALGNNIETARGDLATILQSELTPDGIQPDEPLTMTIQFSQLGNLLSQLHTPVFDNTNYLRMSFAVQTGDGSSTILAVVDNIRFLSTIGLDADFDHDGDVDKDDLPVWRAAFNVNGNADADDDGDSDGNDFLIWQRQLGNDATPSLAAGGAVPEPSSVCLWAVAVAAGLCTRRARARV